MAVGGGFRALATVVAECPSERSQTRMIESRAPAPAHIHEALAPLPPIGHTFGFANPFGQLTNVVGFQCQQVYNERPNEVGFEAAA